MESTSQSSVSALSAMSPSTMALAIIIALFCVYAAYIWYYRRNTVPVPSYYDGFEAFVNQRMPGSEKKGVVQDAFEAGEWFDNPPGKKIVPEKPTTPIVALTSEAFGGVSRGAGSPDCLRNSSEASQLVAMFNNRNSTVEEGSTDIHEMTQLVGKLCCFKKDLLSPSFTVNATRQQPFVTMHDIEPIGETTGRCFAKTISPRDLEIAFDKWNSRGELLIKRLCTAYKLSPTDVDTAQNLFRTVIRDVKDIARGACLHGEPMIAGKPGPRDPHPFQSHDYDEIGEYSGYF